MASFRFMTICERWCKSWALPLCYLFTMTVWKSALITAAAVPNWLSISCSVVPSLMNNSKISFTFNLVGKNPLFSGGPSWDLEDLALIPAANSPSVFWRSWHGGPSEPHDLHLSFPHPPHPSCGLRSCQRKPLSRFLVKLDLNAGDRGMRQELATKGI